MSWGQPVDFDAPTFGPPVPLEAFPDPIAKYIQEVAASVQVPADLVAGAALGVLAAASARRADVAIGNTHVEPLNLYMAPTAKSGERKQFLRAMTFPLEEEETRLMGADESEIVRCEQARAFGEKRLEQLGNRAAKESDSNERMALEAEAAALVQQLPTVPSRPQLLFDDVTPEYLGQALVEQGGRLAIVSEEAGSLFENLAGRYAKGRSNLDAVLKAYDGGSIRVGRLGRTAPTVPHPALTILVTPQPLILESLAAHAEFRGRGLLARFVFLTSRSLVGTRLYQDRPISDTARAGYRTAVQCILALPVAGIADRPSRLFIADAALSRWAEFANEVEIAQVDGGPLSSIPDWASKHAGRVSRIAGILHLANGGTPNQAIPIETVVAAWALGEWMREHALAAFGSMGSTPEEVQARHILKWIRRNGFHTFTLRDLHQHHRQVNQPEDLLPALAVLKGRGFLRIDESPSPKKPGRPRSPSFLVNPATHPHKSHNSQNSPVKDGDVPADIDGDEPADINDGATNGATL